MSEHIARDPVYSDAYPAPRPMAIGCRCSQCLELRLDELCREIANDRKRSANLRASKDDAERASSRLSLELIGTQKQIAGLEKRLSELILKNHGLVNDVLERDDRIDQLGAELAATRALRAIINNLTKLADSR